MMDPAPEPQIELIEQPKQREHRFRYKCEGNGAGSIPGENSTGSVQTTPAIKIHNMARNEKAVVVVSCVNRNEPFHPHPHGLVGHGCDRGICKIQTKTDSIVKLGNVGIQCCRRQDAKEALRLRKELRVDPFLTGHDVDVRQIDLTAVRLCFQVFLPGPNQKFTRVVRPIVTQEIIDKRTVNKLEICRLSRQSTVSRGGEELVILCEKAKKGDVEVRFFEDGSEWEAFGGSVEVHKQYAVICTTPRYSRQMLSGPASVWVQLFRPSDQMTGEPKPFQFIPNELDDQSILAAKRRKIEQRGINIINSSADFHMEEPLLSYGQHSAVPGSGLALMNIVGAATPNNVEKTPPPYPGPANIFSEDDRRLTDLVDLLSTFQSCQPQVNFAQTGQQQRVNLTPHTIGGADFETANQNVSFEVPGMISGQVNQRNQSDVNTNLNGQFVNFVSTGQHHGNQRPYTSGQAALGTSNHLDAFGQNHQADQRQMNLGIFTSNEEVNVAVPSHRGALVNDMSTSQPGFNQAMPQTFCPNQIGYILDSNIGKLSNVDNPFPAGTINVTQAPVEDDIYQDNY